MIHLGNRLKLNHRVIEEVDKANFQKTVKRIILSNNKGYILSISEVSRFWIMVRDETAEKKYSKIILRMRFIDARSLKNEGSSVASLPSCRTGHGYLREKDHPKEEFNEVIEDKLGLSVSYLWMMGIKNG